MRFERALHAMVALAVVLASACGPTRADDIDGSDRAGPTSASRASLPATSVSAAVEASPADGGSRQRRPAADAGQGDPRSSGCGRDEGCDAGAGPRDAGEALVDAGSPAPVCSDGAGCTSTCDTVGAWSCELERCVPPAESCHNGVDDDCNGLVDCDDPACADDPGCQVVDAGSCLDGASCTSACDTTGTWSCAAAACAPPPENCTNGIDDDCNGLVDCDDPACSGDPVCAPPDAGSCADGASCTSACGTAGTWSCAAAACVPPPEDCTNGIDDDCNGLVDCADPACSGNAACCATPGVCDVIGCNGDMGYNNIEDEGTAACWQDPGDCTPENLTAWCTRRGDTDYLWPQLVESSVADNCPESGTVQAVTPVPGTNYGEQYQCVVEGCVTYTCDTPLVLAFDEAAEVMFEPWAGGADFDLSPDQDGSAVRSDWPTAATPWLAMDPDGDGQITSGRELFGSATEVDGRPAPNGFAALAALDANGDGVIDARDPAFARLLLWADLNGDRRSTPNELRSLVEAGVEAIDLGYRQATRCDGRGNSERERAGFRWRDSTGTERVGAAVDVHVRRAYPDTNAR